MSAGDFKSFTVRVPTLTYDRLAKLAAKELSSLNREANIAIRAHLDAAGRARTSR